MLRWLRKRPADAGNASDSATTDHDRFDASGRLSVRVQSEAETRKGDAFMSERKWEDAQACFLRATEIDPGNREALQRKFAEAAIRAASAIRLDPSVAEGHSSVGAALIGQGQSPQAIPHLAKALTLQPKFEEAYRDMLRTFSKRPGRGLQSVSLPTGLPQFRPPPIFISTLATCTTTKAMPTVPWPVTSKHLQFIRHRRTCGRTSDVSKNRAN